MTEYAVMIGAMAAMTFGITLYVQRQVKDRIQGAREYVAGNMGGEDEYEPYYSRKEVDVVVDSANNLEFLGGGVMKTTKGDITTSTFINTICAENEQCD